MKRGPYSPARDDTCETRLDDVRALHYPIELGPGDVVCHEDHARWPCPSERAMEGERR